MKVICIESNIKKIIEESCFRFPGEPAKYDFSVGKEYLVMGIFISYQPNEVYYLVDHGSKPRWIPYTAFEVSDNTVFSDWSFGESHKVTPEGPLFYIIGFKELSIPSYYDALLEGDSRALEIYEIRKRETLEWYQ